MNTKKNVGNAILGIVAFSLLATGCSSTGNGATNQPVAKGLTLEQSVQSLVDTAYTKIGGWDYDTMTADVLVKNGASVSDKFKYVVETDYLESSSLPGAGGFCITGTDGENVSIYDSGVGRFIEQGATSFYCDGGNNQPSQEEQFEVANPKPHAWTPELHPAFCWNGEPQDVSREQAFVNSAQTKMPLKYDISYYNNGEFHSKKGSKEISVGSCANILMKNQFIVIDFKPMNKVVSNFSENMKPVGVIKVETPNGKKIDIEFDGYGTSNSINADDLFSHTIFLNKENYGEGELKIIEVSLTNKAEE